MKILRPPVCAALLAILFCGVSFLHAERPFASPPRESFALFPMRLSSWEGQKSELSSDVLAALKLQDYLLANYRGGNSPEWVNLYIAYYDRQLLGSAAHSPRTCIPGDGWEISDLSPLNVQLGNATISVNRAVIAKGQNRQLVYYWFDQRGRILSSEYAVKWFLFTDGLLRRRTDGALIRLVTPIQGRDVRAADQRLHEFIGEVYNRLRPYVPS
jgi:EpsI family protein